MEQVIITPGTLRSLEREEAELVERLNAVRRKRAAVEVLLNGDDPGGEGRETPKDGAMRDLVNQVRTRQRPLMPKPNQGSVPGAIMDFLKRQGRPMTGKEIRNGMIAEGFDESRFASRNSYFYTAMSNFVANGSLVKGEDGKFRLGE